MKGQRRAQSHIKAMKLKMYKLEQRLNPSNKNKKNKKRRRIIGTDI